MDRLRDLKFALHSALGADGWFALSLFGEANILLPLAAVIALLLWRSGRGNDARAWALAVFGCALTVGALKLAFGDFRWTVYGHTFNARGFPSGHVAMATVFWGGLAFLIARRWSPLVLFPIPLVALTVIVLWWHHTIDVVAGGAIGAAAVLGLVLLRAPRRSPRSAA
jgi:membrane-associated phospholipid phosphatase